MKLKLFFAIVDKNKAEKVIAYQPLAENLMAVHSRRKLFHRVVQVHPAQIAEPDHAVKLLHYGIELLRCTHIIPRRECVLRVYAYAHAALVVHEVYDKPQMLKAVAEVRTLSGGVLYDSRHPFGLVQRKVDALRYAFQALLLRHLFQMRAGMEIKPVQPQQPAPAHLVRERCAALLETLLVGRP